MIKSALLCSGLVALFPVMAMAQEATIPVTDNLIVEGIPPVPASVAERVGRYTEFRAAGFQDWNPRRREVLISTRFGNTSQVHHVAMPLGKRRQLTFFPEMISSAQYNPVSDDFFLFTKDVGGNENYQIYRYDTRTGEPTLLTDGTSRHGTPVWSLDGRFVVYTSNKRTGADFDIYTMDPRNPRSERLVAQVTGGGWFPMDVSPDGRRALVLEYLSINESFVHELDLATGRMTRLTPRPTAAPIGSPPPDPNRPGVQPPAQPSAIAYGSALYARDGRGIFFVSDARTEFSKLRYSADTRLAQGRILTPAIDWDIESFDLSRDGRQIAFAANEAGVSRLYVMDTRNFRPRRLNSVPTGVISNLKWSADGREIGFAMSSAQSSSDVYTVDVSRDRLTRWTESETGGLDASRFATPELVRWKSFDGLEITGFLYMPPGRSGKVPVIVNIHGGPEAQARPVFIGRNNYYLNEMGVAILYPNVRGSSGYGKTFLQLDNGFLRHHSYQDIGALLDWIQANPRLDENRVIVTGGSYGGHMTFAVSYLYPDRIAAAVPVVGMSNLVTFLENTADYRRDLRRVEYGDERDPKMREYLLSIAPMNHAAKITSPTFVIQGVNDPRVPYSEARQFVDLIRNQGHNENVWLLAARDEGHGFAKKSNADFQFYATVMFVERFLLGRPGGAVNGVR
jgi:dipeptidyl aminopeptidase/acylaminoacyl peptidase